MTGIPPKPDDRGAATRPRHRLADALPTWRAALFGSMAWASAMAVVAAIELAWSRWYEPERIALLAAFFAAGGFFSFAPSVFVGRLLSRGRFDAGFAATFLALATATVGLTALLIGLQYREYYASWHEPALSIGWMFQFVFTIATSTYQFLVLTMHIYFPFGLACLFAASLWNVRHMR